MLRSGAARQREFGGPQSQIFGRVTIIRLVIALASGWGMAGCDARAASIPATPATLQAAWARAKAGDILVLKGEFTRVTLAGRKFDPSLTIDASAATLVSWKIKGVSGLHFKGGTAKPLGGFNVKRNRDLWGPALDFSQAERILIEHMRFQGPDSPRAGVVGNPADGYGANFRFGREIDVRDSQFVSLKVGLLFGQIDGFRAQRNIFRAMRSDGIDVANSWHGLIEGNDFRDSRKRDQEHPDAVQLWSRPKAKPTSDILIRENTIVGETQGISGFNHIRDGVDDGGFDRITISGNDIKVNYPHAIAVVDGREVVIRDNHVETLPGARSRASINVGRSPGALRRGNIVEAGAGKPDDSDPDARKHNGSPLR